MTRLLIVVMLACAACGPRMDIHKAEKLMTKGKWQEAEARLLQIAASHPRSHWGQKALMLAGCVQARTGRWEQAERTLEAARDLLPQGRWADDAEYYLARVRFMRGNMDAARDGFRRVMDAYGDDPKRSNCKAMALEELEYMRKKRLGNHE